MPRIGSSTGRHRACTTNAVRRRGAFWQAVAALLVTLGCSRSELGRMDADAGLGRRARQRPIEMFTWWTRVGETDALGALIREHKRRHPEDDIVNASAELSGLARKTLSERMWRGEPPDTFQANVGFDHMRWVIVNGLDARESKVSSVEDVLARANVPVAVFPPAVSRELMHDGKLYGIPANLHRLNEIFYSKRVFAEHGLSEPRTVQDLLRMGERLKAAGVPLLAIGSKEPWTLALLTLECLLVAEAGAGFYEDYFRGNHRPDDQRLRHALATALKLAEYMNQDHPSLSWIQALELVRRDRAAMIVMGDWARVALEAEGAKLGEDFGELPFPGTTDTFVFTSDVFSLPRNALNHAGVERLLDTLLSKEGQAAIHRSRNALPARLDVQLTPGDAVLVERKRLVQTGRLVLAQSGIVPSRFAEDINEALKEMLRERDMEPALHTLRSRYCLLR